MSEAEVPKQDRLLKLLKMTTSSQDGEALTAIRMANKLLTDSGWDWDKLIAGKIKIVENPFKNMPNPGSGAAFSRPTAKPAAPPPRRQPPKPTGTAGYGRKWLWNSAGWFWDDVAVPKPSIPIGQMLEWNYLTESWYLIPDPNYNPRSAFAGKGHGLSRRNNYEKNCYCCGKVVPNQEGFIFKPLELAKRGPDKWMVMCPTCDDAGAYIDRAAAPRKTEIWNSKKVNLGNL